jgi:hypothetical protein
MCSMEECEFIVRTFFQPYSFVTIQRQFVRNMKQALARSAVIHLVQKSELTDGVHKKKKGVI